MFERLASVNQCIKNVFVVCIKGFSYDSDELLKNTPDALGNGELDNPIGRFVKESSDGLIGGETLDCAQNVVLKYGERYAGNLGGDKRTAILERQPAPYRPPHNRNASGDCTLRLSCWQAT